MPLLSRISFFRDLLSAIFRDLLSARSSLPAGSASSCRMRIWISVSSTLATLEFNPTGSRQRGGASFCRLIISLGTADGPGDGDRDPETRVGILRAIPRRGDRERQIISTVAVKLGIHRPTAYAWARKAGIPTSEARRVNPRRDEFLRLRATGFTRVQARAVGPDARQRTGTKGSRSSRVGGSIPTVAWSGIPREQWGRA